MESAYADTGAAAQSPDQHVHGNGLDGILGDEMSADESDDDDSNPLEDLEALGEKEEREKELADQRLREDEEGLRNARELSRQAWDDSLRTTDASMAVNGVPATHDNDAGHADATITMHPSTAPEEDQHEGNSDGTAAIAASVEHLYDALSHVPAVQDHANGLATEPTNGPANGLTHTTETQAREDPSKSPREPLLSGLEQRRSPPAHGGFHAVNEPLAHSKTAAIPQTTWRTT